MKWFQLVVGVEEDREEETRAKLKAIRDEHDTGLTSLEFEESLYDFPHPTQIAHFAHHTDE